MSDRPILFSGPMVRALLEGRKTQTRRVLQPYDAVPHPFVAKAAPKNLIQARLPARLGGFVAGPVFDPRFAVGDRLWVREAIEAWSPNGGGKYVRYAADGSTNFHPWPDHWKRDAVPAMHMPRRASRRTLVVTEVRVQRLWEITGADAVAEGVRSRLPDNGIAVSEFMDLWDSLNAGRGFGWGANPWVVAVTFTAHKGNIDLLKEGSSK